MDWRSIAYDWNQARAFLVTAEEGSLSAAARALGITQPTLGRQVRALEDALGVALFERAGRGLALTPTGRSLLDHVRQMGEAANRVSLSATGQARAVEGTVTISATQVGAAFFVPTVAAQLRQSHPQIRLDIVASNELSDLRRREADIAIRSAQPTDPELIARKVRSDRARLYASISYLEQNGPFDTPEALARGHFIGFEQNDAYLEALQRRTLDVDSNSFVALCTDHLVQWELVKRGIGIGVMTERVADEEPLVRRAAPWFKPFPFDVWLVVHRELKTSRRVRIVFDTLVAALRSL